MDELSAHVRQGRIVLDHETPLPEGAALRIVRVDEGDVDEAERVQIEAAVEEGIAEFERGEAVDARSSAESLVRGR
jgi:hypothetical protein